MCQRSRCYDLGGAATELSLGAPLDAATQGSLASMVNGTALSPINLIVGSVQAGLVANLELNQQPGVGLAAVCCGVAGMPQYIA